MYKPIKDNELEGRIQAFLDRHADKVDSINERNNSEHQPTPQDHINHGAPLKFRISPSY